MARGGLIDRIMGPAARAAGIVTPPTALVVPETEQRVLSLSADGDLEHFGIDLLGQQYGDAAGARLRRLARNNSTIAATYAAVFAAIRWREQSITRPQIVLQQKRGGEWEDVADMDDPSVHPALSALARPAKALPFIKGFGGVERGKLTNGEHFWIKRRDGLGVPVGFEVWSGAVASVRGTGPNNDVPSYVERQNRDGSTTEVDIEDVVWFRHIVDDENPLRSLTPIGAIRVHADNSGEALRYLQRFFDQGIGGGLVVVPDQQEPLSPPEVDRIGRRINQDFAGTDAAHRLRLLDANLKVLFTPQSNHDLQFAEMMRWGVVEVGRAFELSPITLKDFEKATYSNADQAATQDWETIRNQLDQTVEELNEFMIRPDYGDDYRLIARYDQIGALQDDAKAAAEVDEIHLRTGARVINELRERDDLDPVEWGDLPLLPTGVAPLGENVAPAPVITPPGNGDGDDTTDESSGPPPPDDGEDGDGEDGRSARSRSSSPRAVTETPNTEDEPALLQAERAIAGGWERRLRTELRSIIDYLSAEYEDADRSGTEARALELGDVDAYDWNWVGKYGDDVARELARAMEITLLNGGFVETPLLTAHQLAASFAQQRAGEMLRVDGNASVVRTTRARVRVLVDQTLREGESLRTLKNNLRASFEFSPARAETVARTETAIAQGQGARQAARSQGRDEKRWTTAHDENVDGGNPSGPCIENQRAGWISIDDAFPAGHETIPAHPRCRCDVQYRTRR